MKKWLILLAAIGVAVVGTLTLTLVAFAAPQGAAAPAAPPAGGRGRGRGAPRRGPAGPVPMLSDGHPDFSGIWNGQQTVQGNDVTSTGPGASPTTGVPAMLPWAVKVQADRAKNQFADDFEARCLPGGPPRVPPYHIELFSTPKLVLMLFEGNTHMYRQFFVDGSDHPKNLKPTFYGDSRGHWEGDQLVVDTIGFNDISWIDGQGHPHSKQMHLVEKFRRPDFGNLQIEVDIDDPGTYQGHWHMNRVTTIEQGMEITEYVCNENNQDPGHLDHANNDGKHP